MQLKKNQLMSEKTLGIIGGGQLGMFICMAAKKYGLKTIIFSQEPEFSAKEFCDDYLVGDINKNEKIDDFIKKADFFTVETENIPKQFLKKIQREKKLFPSSEIIEITQNRLKEKKFLNSLRNITTTKFFEINNFDDLDYNARKLNFNCILKTQEFGYDGKGQFIINEINLNEFREKKLNKFILEEKINFKLEISVIVARSNSGIVYYPPVNNIHKDSILRETLYPAKINEEIKKDAIEKSLIISESLKLNGVLAVEMFVTKDNKILINELAPRPHNSGHWTMDACKFSQFDNLVSVIKEDKVKKPLPFRNCKMINIIGNDFLSFKKINNDFKAYDYFKKEVRDSRKMGHYILFE